MYTNTNKIWNMQINKQAAFGEESSKNSILFSNEWNSVHL